MHECTKECLYPRWPRPYTWNFPQTWQQKTSWLPCGASYPYVASVARSIVTTEQTSLELCEASTKCITKTLVYRHIQPGGWCNFTPPRAPHWRGKRKDSGKNGISNIWLLCTNVRNGLWEPNQGRTTSFEQWNWRHQQER